MTKEDKLLRKIIKNTEYPKNLLIAILCRSYHNEMDICNIADSISDNDERLSTLDQTINTVLTDKDRLVLYGYFRDKLKYTEIIHIPELEGINISRIPQYLYRAVRILKSQYKSERN